MLTSLSIGVFVFYYIGLINMLYACPTHINLKVYRPRKPQVPLTAVVSKIVLKKILKHLGLWDVKRKPQPVANAPPIDVFHAYDQQPGPSADDCIRDPDYPAEACF